MDFTQATAVAVMVKKAASRRATPFKKPVSATVQGRPQPETRQIPLGAIDWSLALRSISIDHVERLSGAARLPAVKVWEVSPGEYRGVDGYHRWRVARDRGDNTIVAVILHFAKGKEGEKAFDIECIRSNIHHGLPLTKQDRDHAIYRFWTRWGRSKDRPVGETLEDIGKLFNLTRQRVHQILTSTETVEEGSRGFSSFGRFSAATRRMSTLLGDTALLKELVDERRSDVVGSLTELMALLQRVNGGGGPTIDVRVTIRLFVRLRADALPPVSGG